MVGKKNLTDAEYGKHIREMNRKYALRFKAIQSLKDRKLTEAKIVITETEIQAEVKRLQSKQETKKRPSGCEW